MTFVKNNTDQHVTVIIRHACGNSWIYHVAPRGIEEQNTFHPCPAAFPGIWVVCRYADGRIIEGPGGECDNVYVGQFQIRPFDCL